MSGIVRVWTTVPGQKKPKPLLARIVNSRAKKYTIQYLSPTPDKLKGCTIYRYEDDTYEIDDDSIYEYLTLSNEADLGFKEIDDGYIKDDSDEDYIESEDSDYYTESEEEPDEEEDEEDLDEEDDNFVDDEE